MGGSQGCFSSALREPSVELVRDDKDYDKPRLPSGPEGTQSLLLFGMLATDPESFLHGWLTLKSPCLSRSMTLAVPSRTNLWVRAVSK